MNSELVLQKIVLKKMHANKLISEDEYKRQLSHLQKNHYLHDIYKKNRDTLMKETKKQILEYNK
ncbi:hypothetical protein ACUUYQ_19590 [Bacillus halotolerans]|uniref:hypothetical protein n=1 Tax=Bacillus halotolerans TaxID=260554 RepID=UPI0040456335